MSPERCVLPEVNEDLYESGYDSDGQEHAPWLECYGIENNLEEAEEGAISWQN